MALTDGKRIFVKTRYKWMNNRNMELNEDERRELE
jgi:hypothetical protein